MDTTQDSSETQSVPSVQEKNYQKIGGWLILVAIGVVLNPLFYLFFIFANFSPLFLGDIWPVLTTPGTDAYHPMWAPLILYEIVVNVALFIFSIAVAITFFQKRKILPKLIITFMLSSLAFPVIDMLMANSIPIIAGLENNDSINGIIRSAITCAIWVPYFIKSERVKGTFVN